MKINKTDANGYTNKKMKQEQYLGYLIKTNCHIRDDGRYSVEVIIEKEINRNVKNNKFIDIRTSLLLEIEAEKESINFGKNLIKNNFVGF